MLTEIFEITTNTRIHWIYLASSLVISLFFIKPSKKLILSNVKLQWFWNSSTKLDLKLFITNRFLKFFLILPLEAFLIFKICKAWLLLDLTTDMNLNLSSSLTLAVYTIIVFVFDDFLRFFQHLLMHKVPFLWEVHKVHHSAHVLTPLSLYRIHFLEVVISGIRRVAGTSLVTCLMLSITSNQIQVHQILNALSISFVFNLIGGNLRHSHIPFSFGFLDHIFISPAQHQVHHSKNKLHFDKNFGVALAVWDKLLGTWHESSKKPLRFGLNYNQRNHKNNLRSSLIDPLRTSIPKFNLSTLWKSLTIFEINLLQIRNKTFKPEKRTPIILGDNL